jgi:lysophospholipase L1-like esterase
MDSSNKKAALLPVFLCLAMVAAAVTIAIISNLRQPEPPRVYIALGDSVSFGFGVDEENRYADVLFARLKEEGFADEYVNMGANGYTTAMLLNYLKGLEDEDLEHFGNASVITVNIGGNNILAPFISYLPSINTISDRISSAGDVVSGARDVVSGVWDFFGDFSISEFNISDLLEIPGFIMDDVVPIFDDAANIFGGIIDFNVFSVIAILLGSFPAELEAELQKGAEAFADELEEIIDWLEENAPDATVIVNTIYNPIPGEIMGLTFGFSSRADEFTSGMNAAVFELARERSVLVADVYSAFQNEQRVMDFMNFNLDVVSLILNFDIIHPNEAGHEIISGLNFNSLAGNE